MFLTILKKAVPLPKITKCDNFLFVGPHPDDIEVACGATVARLTKMGKKVTFLVATDGSVGGLDPSLTSQQLIQIRRQEALKSAQMLGVADVRFLPYADGGDYDLRAMRRDIVSVILDVKPQMVFCPDHTVPSECHPDHLNVGRVVTESVFCAQWDKITSQMYLEGSVTGVSIAYYYTHKPNSYVGVAKTYKLHMEAIACHKSQFTPQQLKDLGMYFGLRQRRLGCKCCKRRADGYRVLGPTHQHCMPEASLF